MRCIADNTQCANPDRVAHRKGPDGDFRPAITAGHFFCAHNDTNVVYLYGI